MMGREKNVSATKYHPKFGLIHYRQTQSSLETPGPPLLSFGDSIMTRVCQIVPGAPGEITVTTYSTTAIINDSAGQVKKMRGTTVVDEMLLLL